MELKGMQAVLGRYFKYNVIHPQNIGYDISDQRMLPRTPEGRSLLLEVLQLLFDGYVRTGDCASLKLEDPFLALVNRLYCSRAEGNGTEEGEAVSNLMLDIFRHRDLATVR